MRSFKYTTLTLAVLALLSANCKQKPEVTLTVWHAWKGADAQVLDSIATDYQRQNGVTVQLVEFDTPKALLEGLLQGDKKPDAFIGYHTWAGDLLAKGLIGAYCDPDLGQCSECNVPNPPRWCQYASGNFTYRAIGDFLMKVGYCEPDQCPACFRDNPPPWCRLASQDFGITIDVLQASMAAVSKNNKVFPYGIPVWWEYVGIFANPDKLAEHGLAIPKNLSELSEVLRIDNRVYYESTFFARTGLALPGAIAGADPQPAPSIPGILVASSDHFTNLQKEVSQLTLLELQDYRPELLVHGVYLHSSTAKRVQALDFMYFLTDYEAQISLFKGTGHFPANGVAIPLDPIPVKLMQFGKKGLLSGAMTRPGI